MQRFEVEAPSAADREVDASHNEPLTAPTRKQQRRRAAQVVAAVADAAAEELCTPTTFAVFIGVLVLIFVGVLWGMSAITKKAPAPGPVAPASAAVDLTAMEQQGMQHLNAALALEVSGNVAAASDSYTIGLSILMSVLKQLPDTERYQSDRDRVRKVMGTYLSRAEKLKGGGQAAAHAAAAPAFVQTQQKVVKAAGAGAARSKAKVNDRKTTARGGAAGGKALGGAAGAQAGAAAKEKENDKIDPALRQIIENEILDADKKIAFKDVIGLNDVKQALNEMVILPSLRPDLFSGLRQPPKGLLMFGPPGNGKTHIAKAVANESGATFFAISASSLTSKWLGEGEKLVRTLFAVARERAPAIIFIDEIDSILAKRKESDHDAAKRLKTEFLIQFDGVANSADDRVVVIGATNLPETLDDAVLRRLNRQIFVPCPDAAARHALLTKLLAGQQHALSAADVARVVAATEGFSASDVTALAREAAYGPIRDLGAVAAVVAVKSAAALKPITLQHFLTALKTAKPSVSPERMKHYLAFAAAAGATGAGAAAAGAAPAAKAS